VQLAAAVGRPDLHAGELPVAYVQLKSGVRTTEEELLSFARDQITERAAMPKAIRLVATMPLTGVGKIFKPELRQRETVDALRTALHDAGAWTSRLEVIDDPRLGIQIEVVVADIATAGIAREVLGQFPFRFDVSWTSGDR
jgi:fatty-acyl-CoA synthase